MGVICHALHLMSTPDRWQTHGVILKLNAHNTSPSSATKPYLFTFENAFEVSYDYLITDAEKRNEKEGMLEMKAQLDMGLKFGANGAQIGTLILITCENVQMVQPHLAVGDIWHGLDESEHWKETVDSLLRVCTMNRVRLCRH
jgi:hypothetical protein